MKGRGVSASNLARVYGRNVLASEVFKVGCAAMADDHESQTNVLYRPVSRRSSRAGLPPSSVVKGRAKHARAKLQPPLRPHTPLHPTTARTDPLLGYEVDP